nr:immunoglobulin heavy chain junction region [Macaca mulatta]MOX60511.1 immunoglobulin heavy chain junction region [Macaca mulatta]
CASPLLPAAGNW